MFSLSYYILFCILPMGLALWAQSRVKAAYGKYSQIPVSSNVTGAEAARDILNAAEIHDVQVVQVDGVLNDHYDPVSKQLRLSSENYNSTSVAAVGIAAHETGHAIQHARAYAPLQARMAIVPVTQVVSKAWWFIFMAGLFFRSTGLIQIGILCFAVVMVFQLITLPVEFDASRRAKVILQHMGIVRPGEEAGGVSKVLDAAALTYVAAFAAAFGQLLWLLSQAQRR